MSEATWEPESELQVWRKGPVISFCLQLLVANTINVPRCEVAYGSPPLTCEALLTDFEGFWEASWATAAALAVRLDSASVTESDGASEGDLFV